MIKKVDMTNIKEIVDFAYKLNGKAATSSKSCPNDKKLIEKHFIKIINHQHNFIIADYTQNKIRGVFACLAEPESKYLECLGGFFINEEVLQDFIMYFKNIYSGWHLDLVYPKENKLVLDYLKENNGDFFPMQIEMEIYKDQVKKENYVLSISEYKDIYFEGYKKIHDTTCYWIADKVVKAKEKFSVYLALENDEVIGYLDISKNNEVSLIYNIFVKENFRKKGYGRALMQQALADAFVEKKKVILSVNADNEIARRLYTNIGFVEIGNSITIGLDL